MTRIATCTQTIIGNTTPDLLAEIFTPVVTTASLSAQEILKEEEALKGKADAEAEQEIADVSLLDLIALMFKKIRV